MNKSLLRILVAASLALFTGLTVVGQQGPNRAEFECLAITNSSAEVAVHGDPAPARSFHHVWTPGLSYGFFSSNGTKLMYETQGGANEVVIVVHGGPGLPHEYFHPMLSNLSRYAKLVYFDRRAELQSMRDPGNMVSLDEMADDVDALRQSLGLNRVTLLAHSFGGAIALNYALRHPENVKRLILVSTAAAIENPLEAEKRIVDKMSPEELAMYHSGEGGTGAAQPCERVRRRYAALYTRHFHKLVPYEFDRGVYTVYYDALAKKQVLAAEPGRADVRAQLGEIKAPTLVVTGRHDPVTTLAQANELAGGLAHSRLAVMEHSAHFPFFEENYLFTQWVRRFIESTNDVLDDRMTLREVGATGSR